MSITLGGPFTDSLYKTAIDEEHWFLEAQHKREIFYSSIITTVIGATIAGALSATLRMHYLFLLVGPVLIIVLSDLGRRATKRFYRRYLEAVTIRAKIEQAKGFTLPLETPEVADPYWPGEPLIPTRHLNKRGEEQYKKESQKFCDDLAEKGYQGTTNRYFEWVKHIAKLLIVLLLIGAIWGGG